MKRFSLQQSVRRILSVVVLVLGLFVFVAILLGKAFLVLALVFAVLYLVVLAVLNRSASQVVRSVETKLDERQKVLRYKAHWLAYRVVVTFAFCTVLVNGVYFSEVRITLGLSDTPFATLLLLVNLFLITALPTVFVAWLEPDPVTEDTAFTGMNPVLD